MMWSKLRALACNTRRLLADRGGVAAIEFAMAAPLLVTLFLGSTELSRLILVHAKAEKVAFTVSDLIAQEEQQALTNTEISLMLDAAAEVMSPFTFDSEALVIVTSVTKTGTNAPTVRWQRTRGSFSASSQVGAVGANASLPAGFTMADKDNIIIAEVYYRYTPVFGSQIVGAQTIYKTAYLKPRLGALTGAPT
jgi:Flp pilus assembly protein TadG